MNIIQLIKNKLFYSEISAALKSSDNFIAYLRRKGVTIGEGCTIYSPISALIDITRPELVNIGNNVKIAAGSFTLLTHGFDWCVLRELYPGEIFGSAGKVIIKNNVFIGSGCIVLPHAIIGNNCVIGAGSIVIKDIPDNSVAVGIPAKRIMDIGELYDKYKKRQVEEAKECALAIYNKRGCPPRLGDFKEFFFLFASAEEAEKSGIDVKAQTTEKYYKLFKQKNTPKFKSFQDFLEYCGIKIHNG